MIVDLHTHTTASDGEMSPQALVDFAVDAGVEVLAITDHDTVSGGQVAADYLSARALPLRLISGVELSCRWSGATIHVLGLNIDPGNEVLVAGLRTQAEAREKRAQKIAARLQRAGFEGALEGARQYAGSDYIGRPHFARYMEIGRAHV